MVIQEINTIMTSKDQELIAEAYVNEVFGFGSKPKIVDLKKELDPDEFQTVASVFRVNPKIKNYIQSCNLGSCLIDKNKIPKICSILKSDYESMQHHDANTDDIIDTHDILADYNYRTS